MTPALEASAGRWATLGAIRSYLPERVVTNEELAPSVGWPAEKILEKTGIAARHVAAEDECVSDMATAAAGRLLAEAAIDPASVQFLILCTQTPDHCLPATACLVQQGWGWERSAPPSTSTRGVPATSTPWGSPALTSAAACSSGAWW
jgi:3-oxoacyl-[acyl-carrier-protein] synthase III